MSTSNRQSIRVLAYSHDSYGLGHVRRSLSVVGAMVRRDERVSALCVTGSPEPHLFELPRRCDLVRLPCITKNAEGRYRPRSLPLPMREVVAMRSDLIMASVRSFRPDLLLVDHTAIGTGAELLPVLRQIRQGTSRTRVVLGMRDVIDAPHRVRAQMIADRTPEVLGRDYDEILVYGERALLDVGREYAFPSALQEKTSYVGFACRPPRSTDPEREQAAGRPRRLVASAGGGADGYPVLRGVVAALRGGLREADLEATIVAGPLMPGEELKALRKAVRDDSRIRVHASTSRMPSLVDKADLVIGMGGYNSVYESLSAGKRLLAWPRSEPRLEQLERCRRLAEAGLLTLLSDQDVADQGRMSRAIEVALASPVPDVAAARLRFDGADRAAEHLLESIDSGVRVEPRSSASSRARSSVRNPVRNPARSG